jgi:hypothetical protein
MAVVCAVSHTAYPVTTIVTSAAMTPASGQRSATPALAEASRTAENSTAVTMPMLVGRKYMLMRIRARPAACSSTSARTSSQPHRPTSTLRSRSCDQPSSISILRTACDRRSQSVRFVSTRSVFVQVSLQ